MSERVPGEHVEGEGSYQRLYQEYLRAMYVLFKSAFVYDTNNQALVAAADRVATAANRIREAVNDVASLELMAEGSYVNRTLLKLDPSTYEQADYLFTICGTLGVAAIAAISDTSTADWVDLVAAFKRCVGPGGELSMFVKADLANIQLTPVRGAVGASNVVAMTSRFRALRAYATTVIAIGEVIESAREGRPLRPLRIKRPLQEVVSLAEEAGPLLLALAHLKRHKLTVAHHLANTAVLTICAARPLRQSRSAVCTLALSAALHDVGRAFADAEPDAVGPIADRHYAHEAVRKLIGTGAASVQMQVRAVLANEIRRWVDRRAEPAGDVPYPFDISTSTRLVGVARAYSLLTTSRPDRPSLLPDEALRVIMRDAGRRYDHAAVKLFVNALGVYPVGSTVALSDGRMAVVIEAPHEAAGPTRPKVKIVSDAGGTILDGALLDLSTADGAGLEIVRCIDGEARELNAPAFLLS